VCGDQTFGRPFTEESRTAPRSAYAASKLEAERRLAAVCSAGGLPLTILRPTLVYGPGNGGNMLRLLRLIDSGWPLPLHGIKNRRNLTYVGNLISAIGAALRKPQINGTFIVCDKAAVSTPQLVQALAEGMGTRPRLFRFPQSVLRLGAMLTRQEEALRGLVGSLEADCSKLSHALDWRAPIDSQQGLVDTGRWFRSLSKG
jgi:nucleoside-diphosphate-sugar epimerase